MKDIDIADVKLPKLQSMHRNLKMKLVRTICLLFALWACGGLTPARCSAILQEKFETREIQEQIEPQDPTTNEGVITIQLHEERIVAPGKGITQLFWVSENDEIYDAGEPHKIVRPDDLIDEKLAYLRIFFAGRKGVVGKATMVLVVDHDSKKPRFIIDQNNNLDFSDDPQSELVESKDGDHILTVRGDIEESKFSICLSPFRNIEDLTEKKKEGYREMFEGFIKHMGGTPADTDDWFYDQRLNTRTTSVEIDGHPLMIGLHDYDCDGLYSGEADRLIIGEFDSKQISYRRADGAVSARVGEIFLVGKTPYCIVEADPAGQFLRIRRSEKMPDRLFVGSPMPNLEVTSLSGETTTLKSFSNPEKLLVLDFWGHWCAPCVAAIPETIEFNDKWKSRVTLVGVHYGEQDEARRIIDENEMDWPQLEFTDEMKETLFIDGWPTYVLIDADGTILSFGTTLKEITERLEK
ncbi:thioredoxin-like domain-containing protein [bacterium]|nr:thioredoxin-like domain-containing protein [bacterium]